MDPNALNFMPDFAMRVSPEPPKPSPTTPNSIVCDDNEQFTCRDGHKCIPMRYYCDGTFKDCGDGSDEDYCPNRTPDWSGSFFDQGIYLHID